ncbi:E3 ubiquitin-protein ligase RGLG1-like [Hibiscus syriacus]|uniref:E3 ubiquitin-protein ligase RGLG1-like n=1 Tax=Hibiscus syriacus TaxID=106335 RepID=UPI0019206CC7|nr:E3 ubiquitin-protein ligase RGLG1-like [Hibiscus syriacus]
MLIDKVDKHNGIDHSTKHCDLRYINFPCSNVSRIIFLEITIHPMNQISSFVQVVSCSILPSFVPMFVDLTKILSEDTSPSQKKEEFALAALMKIQSHYKAAIELNILGDRNRNIPWRVPPTNGLTSFSPSAPQYPEDSPSVSSATPSPSSTCDILLCPICRVNSKDMAFGCGHLNVLRTSGRVRYAGVGSKPK